MKIKIFGDKTNNKKITVGKVGETLIKDLHGLFPNLNLLYNNVKESE